MPTSPSFDELMKPPKGNSMIVHLRHSLLILAVAVVLAAFGPADDSNASAAKAVATAPIEDTLLALDKQATHAYVRGDGKFFEHLLSDKLVMQQGGSRLSKSDVIKMISGTKCQVKERFALNRPRMLKIDNDVYVLSYVSDMRGRCTADVRSEKMRSTVRAATVWVRNGKRWQVAFHGGNPVVDPTAPPVADKNEASQKDGNAAAANGNTTAAPGPAKPIADPITGVLMQAENSIWDAWMTKDAPRLEDLTAKGIAFVDIFGTYSPNKATVMKVWTSALCEVSGFSLTNGVGTIISPDVAILTLTGTVNGTCGGKDISGQKIYGNSVYVKEGNAWKWVFGFNSPT